VTLVTVKEVAVGVRNSGSWLSRMIPAGFK